MSASYSSCEFFSFTSASCSSVSRSLTNRSIMAITPALSSLFFIHLSLLQLRIKILDQQIDHGNHTSIVLAFFGVSFESLGRSRRGISLPVHRNLSENCRFHLWRWLVQLWIVEFVESIFCEQKDFLCCCITLLQFFVVCIFILSLLSRLCHRLVQFFDTCLQRCNLFRQSG